MLGKSTASELLVVATLLSAALAGTIKVIIKPQDNIRDTTWRLQDYQWVTAKFLGVKEGDKYKIDDIDDDGTVFFTDFNGGVMDVATKDANEGKWGNWWKMRYTRVHAWQSPEIAAPTPTFLGIPVELRLRIYGYVFAGSRVTFTPARRRDTNKPVEKAQSDAFTTEGHVDVLLTCKQCYSEGRTIFWEHARLRAGVDPWSDTNVMSIYYLSESISDFTKAHVKHLRVAILGNHPGEEPRIVLSQFLRLKTCEIFMDYRKTTKEEWAANGDNPDAWLAWARLRNPILGDSHAYLNGLGFDVKAAGVPIFLVRKLIVGPYYQDDYYRNIFRGPIKLPERMGFAVYSTEPVWGRMWFGICPRDKV
ncbi:Uu.00g055840.m01.CDS01 [Anthostomella pinea]|uniref:Uu.00g055840.m01.CDS01 n=1 Tax=Anthostomella pinea TaxID=933095 RepID=A0AAI8VXK8_9PEZI|nr:Uu.00g055840.m01.CDS01 [Anthostomella pinea]